MSHMHKKVDDYKAKNRDNASLAYDFFVKNPSRTTFIARTDPGDLRLIDLCTRDPEERVRRLRIMEQLGFEPYTVHERVTPLRYAGGFHHTRTPLLVHREIEIFDTVRLTHILSVFESHNYVLPEFRHLSAFEFWEKYWREEFISAECVAHLCMAELMKMASHIKYGLARAQNCPRKADRRKARSKPASSLNLRLYRKQCVVA